MQRFTQRARRVLSRAQEEAAQSSRTLIGTEHVLLGLLFDDGGIANRVMKDLGLEVGRVKMSFHEPGHDRAAASVNCRDVRRGWRGLVG